MNEPPKISKAPAQLQPVEVLPPLPKDSTTPDQTSNNPPIHALSALILLVVDNLWNLTEWAVIDWIITVPLCFIMVLVPVFLIQKFLKRNTTGEALGWAIFLAVLAAVPFSVIGTFAGSVLLGWLGINKLWGRPNMKRVN